MSQTNKQTISYQKFVLCQNDVLVDQNDVLVDQNAEARGGREGEGGCGKSKFAHRVVLDQTFFDSTQAAAMFKDLFFSIVRTPRRGADQN